MPEGPLKSRTVMMRDECSGRSLAASGRLIQCSNNVLQFQVQNSKTSHTSQKGSATRKELPRGHLPSLDTPASKKGWARSAGMQNVGEHCSGNGAGLIGTLGRIGGSLNLDWAGGTSSQVPGTIGLPEHVQTVLGTCRPVWGGRRDAFREARPKAVGRHYLSSWPIREITLDAPKGSAPATRAAVSHKFPALPPVAVSRNVVQCPRCFSCAARCWSDGARWVARRG